VSSGSACKSRCPLSSEHERFGVPKGVPVLPAGPPTNRLYFTRRPERCFFDWSRAFHPRCQAPVSWLSALCGPPTRSVLGFSVLAGDGGPVPVPRCAERMLLEPPCCLVIWMTCIPGYRCHKHRWAPLLSRVHVVPTPCRPAIHQQHGRLRARSGGSTSHLAREGPGTALCSAHARCTCVGRDGGGGGEHTGLTRRIHGARLAVRPTCTPALPLRWGSDPPRRYVRLRRGALSASSVSPPAVVLRPLFVASHSWRSRRRRRHQRAACVACTSP